MHSLKPHSVMLFSIFIVAGGTWNKELKTIIFDEEFNDNIYYSEAYSIESCPLMMSYCQESAISAFSVGSQQFLGHKIRNIRSILFKIKNNFVERLKKVLSDYSDYLLFRFINQSLLTIKVKEALSQYRNILHYSLFSTKELEELKINQAIENLFRSLDASIVYKSLNETERKILNLHTLTSCFENEIVRDTVEIHSFDQMMKFQDAVQDSLLFWKHFLRILDLPIELLGLVYEHPLHPQCLHSAERAYLCSTCSQSTWPPPPVCSDLCTNILNGCYSFIIPLRPVEQCFLNSVIASEDTMMNKISQMLNPNKLLALIDLQTLKARNEKVKKKVNNLCKTFNKPAKVLLLTSTILERKSPDTSIETIRQLSDELFSLLKIEYQKISEMFENGFSSFCQNDESSPCWNGTAIAKYKQPATYFARESLCVNPEVSPTKITKTAWIKSLASYIDDWANSLMKMNVTAENCLFQTEVTQKSYTRGMRDIEHGTLKVTYHPLMANLTIDICDGFQPPPKKGISAVGSKSLVESSSKRNFANILSIQLDYILVLLPTILFNLI